MNKERNMAEALEQREGLDASSLIVSGIKEQGIAMARHTIGFTPTPTPEDVENQDAFAHFLSKVQIDDPHFETLAESLRKNIDQAILAEAASITYAKVEAAKQIAPTPVKKEIEKEQGGFLGKVSELLSSNKTTRKALIKASPALMGVVLTACGAQADAGTPPRPIETEMPLPQTTEVSESTQIAPAETGDVVIVFQEEMTAEEILAVDPRIDETYQNFQIERRLESPEARFDVWGALARAEDGQTFAMPFFEEYAGERLIGEYVVRLRNDGSLVYLKLETREMQGPDGRAYLTLAQTRSEETGEELPEPIPYIWLARPTEQLAYLTSEQRSQVEVRFNGLGGIVIEGRTLGGGREMSIRERMFTVEMELAPIQQERAVMASPELSFNMELVAGKDEYLYQLVIEAFARADPLQDYWQTLGLTRNPTPEMVLEYLRTHDYFLPGEAGGFPLRILASRRSDISVGAFFTNPLLRQGIYLDGIRMGIYPWHVYEDNSELRGYIDYLRRENTNEVGTSLVQSSYHYEEMGFLVTSDQRLLLIAGNQSSDPYFHFQTVLGGANGEFRESSDPEIASSIALTYLTLFRNWVQEYETRHPLRFIYAAVGSTDRPDLDLGINPRELNEADILFQPVSAP